MRMTQANFDKLIDLMNHNVTSIKENMISISIDVSWLKKLFYTMIGFLGVVGGSILTIAFKL